MELGRVCVFCGSSGADVAEFAEAADAVGALLARNRITLVYGGGAVGLMGVLAEAALAAGGEVIGVIPRNMFRREVPHPGLTTMIEVGSMHERKQRMSELADAFVALPGGLGTLEELTETATWSQLGLHRKPIATLDVLGYWKDFHDFLRKAADHGLINPGNLRLIRNVTDVAALLPALRSYTAPRADKLVEMDET